ncbi:4-alpha-glucanotransferase [Abditibacteriota bacterium]|nr:4-alpha-glucanotransferase [Abditibacteriota bacterium]
MSTREMPFPRSSGVLLHITSLPGRYGIGDLGQEAREFVDNLSAAGQSYWQVLPIGPTGFADSPYQCLSSFAGNPNLIALDQLQSWIPPHALDDTPPFRHRRVEYETVIPWHDEMLSLVYEGFVIQGGRQDKDFLAFCQENAYWLDDFALFTAIKESHQQRPWVQWPKGEAFRSITDIEAAQDKHRARIEEHKFRQWIFFTQWNALREYARERGISLIGDIPIYAAHDSSDVWVNRPLFDLDENGYPRAVAGVPPDYFSPTGQLWGNPLYLWDQHKKKGYDWWIKRFRATLALFDVVRVDHFRAFYDYWQIPGSAETAMDGTWRDGPRDAFFDVLGAALLEAPGRALNQVLIAEDLGDKMTQVRAWKDAKGLAGMKILQFAFGDNEDDRIRFKPEKYDGANDDPSIMYVGTHDNNTALGWWFNEATEPHRRDLTHALQEWHPNPISEISEPAWELIQMGLESKERLFIMPLQDVLGLGNSGRMNKPGVTAGNWRWRYTREELSDQMWKRLAQLTRQSERFKT